MLASASTFVGYDMALAKEISPTVPSKNHDTWVDRSLSDQG